jgi:prohibitin 1
MSNNAVTLLNNVAKWAAGLGVLGSIAQNGLYTVDGGERAVIFDRLQGVLDESKGEGMHVMVRTNSATS